MSLINFNINDNVRVKLTDRGRKVHREDHEAFWARQGMTTPPVYVPPVEDENGWSRWQMWNLMAEFGPHTTIGFDPCFETTIQIETGGNDENPNLRHGRT